MVISQHHRSCGLSGMQEMVYAVALSEAIYRLVDDGPVAAVSHANHILSGVPSADIPPINVQCSLSSVPHRYDDKTCV